MVGISIAMVVGLVITPGYNSSINAFFLKDTGLVHPSNYTDSSVTASKSRQNKLEESKDARVDADLFGS